MPSLLINKQREKKKQKFTRFSTIDGEEIERFELSENTPHEEFITSRMTINIILLKSMERVSVTKEDNSPDQIAGANRLDFPAGQTSICLATWADD